MHGQGFGCWFFFSFSFHIHEIRVYGVSYLHVPTIFQHKDIPESWTLLSAHHLRGVNRAHTHPKISSRSSGFADEETEAQRSLVSRRRPGGAQAVWLHSPCY